jgi:hypothetical protein
MISLLMGVLSIALVGMVLFFIWLDVSIPRQTPPQLAPSNLVAGVRTAASCESLKAVCSSLASIHDDQSNFLSAQNRMVDRLLNYIVILVVGWGLVSAACSFYLFWITRGKGKADVAP